MASIAAQLRSLATDLDDMGYSYNVGFTTGYAKRIEALADQVEELEGE